MEAYCVKCRAKREIQQPVAGFNANGSPVTTGLCGVCNTKLYRLGRTSAHDALPELPPKKQKKDKRKGKMVIVESPAKARTVGRYLGKDFTVKASVGHVRDLLRSNLSVDIENDFAPKYRVPNEKREVVKELKKLAKGAEQVFLATDPDREGEAIAWHLLEAAEIDRERSHRVVFHEITKPAIQKAFSSPRQIDMNLVDAQQARRILDRLVGYSLSPLLWEKVRSRLSAGRVQSVVLRLIVEREREIETFEPEEYWTIEAELKPVLEVDKEVKSYIARLVRVDGKDADLPDEESTMNLVDDLEGAGYRIKKIKRGVRRRKPAPPFITSTLQQDASRRLGFTTKRTMMIAQQLYEGQDIGEDGGSTGLITYMRTDSTHISDIALTEVRDWIKKTYGDEYLPEHPRVFKMKKAVAAQEAHEAIRPTSVLRDPKSIKKYLTRDQYRLYQIIWQRFVASQMEAAVYDTMRVDIQAFGKAHKYLFRSTGSTLRFQGFLLVYEEAKSEDASVDKDVFIPAELEERQVQELIRLIPEQHFTQPPPRYSEASLVKTLEEFGIGRPSTYAPILSNVQSRGYVYREDRRLFPTETGVLVNDLLVEHFSDVVDTSFTAEMEKDLDQIASGDLNWVDVVREFYNTFEVQLENAKKEIPVSKVELEKIGRTCEKCGGDLVIRWGRYGKFISCSNFPDCRYTEPWLEMIGVACPKCGGDIVQRRSRKGRIFYGCSKFPECDFISWKRPVPSPCEKCGGMLVVVNKREVKCLQCEESFLQEEMDELS